MKNLDWGLLLATLICVVFWAGVIILCSGCGEEQAFIAGLGVGIAGMAEMAEDSQDEFVAAMNNIDALTAELNALAGSYEGLVKPETIAAIEKMKDRTKDPVAWIALASILGNAFLGGRGSKKKTE